MCSCPSCVFISRTTASDVTCNTQRQKRTNDETTADVEIERAVRPQENFIKAHACARIFTV